MRPSTTSTRASHAPGSQPPPPPSATLLARQADKKKEFDAVDALERASELFVRRLEGLADDSESMADAGIGACVLACVHVLAWPALARVHTSFFSSSSSLLLI
jgi:DASH complex subunit DAD2